MWASDLGCLCMPATGSPHVIRYTKCVERRWHQEDLRSWDTSNEADISLLLEGGHAVRVTVNLSSSASLLKHKCLRPGNVWPMHLAHTDCCLSSRAWVISNLSWQEKPVFEGCFLVCIYRSITGLSKLPQGLLLNRLNF